MDHGYAHPSHNLSLLNLPNNDLNRQQTPRRPLSFLNLSNPSLTLRRPPQKPLDTPLTLPQRWLHLRNAGFRAPRLPSHRLSTRIQRWFSEKEDDNHIQHHRTVPSNRENSSLTVRRRNPRDTHPPGTILQEITNPTRSRHSEKSTSVSINEEDQDNSPTLSWYHDAPSTQQSPITFGIVHEKNANEMKLREISGNAQRSPPPLSSPLARQSRGRSKRGLNLRKTSCPASEHIVFLENKSEEVEKSQYSPDTGLPLKDKIRALTNENNRLQEMLGEPEHHFENRLRESVEHKTSMEVNLRRKIKQLEEEICSKDSQIRDLEYRNDNFLRDLSNAKTYKAAVERLESEKKGLEETNRSLEKRNDVLTELLCHSPTRSHHGFELPSPVRDRNTRTPRPRSMMPRIPSSPPRGASSRPLSLYTVPSPFQHDYFSPLSAIRREHDHPRTGGENVDPQKFSDDSQSVDSGLGESCSVRSGDEPISKRSSIHSYASAGPAAWGLPSPPSPTESVERSSWKRKNRRFASGSTQLKPLVLPTLNATGGVSQSAHDTYSTFGRRNVSEQSMDPTISFLSRSYDSPTQPRRRSTTWSDEDALQVLEGNNEFRYISFEEALANQEVSQSLPDSPLTFPDPPNHLNHNYPSTRFSPNLLDEVIVEEDGRAFLNNQVEVAGDQSFSSKVGQLSITESDIDRACVEDHTLTTQFLKSELPRPLNIELPLSFQPGPPVGSIGVEDLSQTNQVDGEALLEPTFSGTISSGSEFVNTLAAPDLLPDATFQPNTTSSSADFCKHNSCEHRISSAWGCLSRDSDERLTIARHSTDIGIQTAKTLMPNPLKAVPSHPPRQRPPRAPSPLEVLQRKGSPTVPLTSVSTRTIFGTISRYISYIREIRRNPTILARRVIANAWCSNWKRLGRLSWWVLGLFLGPGWKRQAEDKQGWEAYDGENIAWAEHERVDGPGPIVVQETHRTGPSNLVTPQRSRKAQQKRVGSQESARTRGLERHEASGAHGIKRKGQEQNSEISWGKSLYLWGKFSVAIMLAVGGAVIKGPGELLKDCDLHSDGRSGTRSDDVHSTHDADASLQDTLSDDSLDDPEENSIDDEVTTVVPNSKLSFTIDTQTQKAVNCPSTVLKQ